MKPDVLSSRRRSQQQMRAQQQMRSAARFPHRRVGRQNGAVLIIALGVLTIMAILGTAFAQLMRLEKRATENYLESHYMDALLESGLSRVIAELQGAKNYRSYSVYRDNPWLYILRGQDSMGHGRVGMNDRRVSRWDMFARRAGTEHWYNTKVLDCTSQLNLNGRQDTLARMLDNLGQAIERSSRLKLDGKQVTNPFYERKNRGGRRLRGADIVRLRRRLPNGKFASKAQLRQLIGRENFEIVKDFVTCYGWEDPYTYKPLDGIDEVPAILGLGGGVGGGTASDRQPPASDMSPRMDLEPRYPVNVNTAPEEVLVACLQGLAGRRVFPYSNIGLSMAGATASMTPVDANAQILGQRLAGVREEIGDVLPRAIFVYMPRLEYQNAKQIADRIIAQRKLRPFMTWRTNEAGQQGFEDFIDQLETSFFPAPGNNVIVIDPDQPANRQIGRLLQAGGASSPVSRMWIKGTAQGSTRSAYINAGLAFHDNNAWYYELAKGVLKANFNPNTRIARYNPNSSVYNPVDKSGLVWAQDNFSLFKGHTTEFCFDTNGFYEITTRGQIGEIKDRILPPSNKRRGGRRTGRQRYIAPFVQPFKREPFERTVRTVVQLFGVQRHTSQFHFERTFQSQSLSSANNRKFVVTWPEPMEALTELYSGGALRDGRVELAGLLDGNRMQSAYQSRTQTYKANQNLAMAIGFDTRDTGSIAGLRRALRGGGGSILSDEVSERLRDVLNPPQFGNAGGTSTGRMGSFYRRRELIELNAYPNPEAVHRDPEVNKEVQGMTLMPDGFHSSILQSPHLNSQHLYIPARQHIALGREESAVTRVGASSVGSRGIEQGNVPYYNGGIAFWVKFDFNGDDPVFSGLVGCTEIIREVSQNSADYRGSEGSQFFVFKNSNGELRVVRMYYHQAFLQKFGQGGGAVPILYPRNPDDPDTPNPIKENLDPQKVVARADHFVSIRHWRAHEWHHVAVEWNDRTPGQALRVFLDFQEVRGGGPFLPQQSRGPGESWVRLNDRQPRDGIQIGGFVREQGDSQWGIFKWFTTTQSSGGARGGVRRVAEDVKRMMANATIDEFVAFRNAFLSVKTYYASSGAPGYFTNQLGEYANVFEVPMPPHVDYLTLRSIDWTSYYPALYTDSQPNSVPQPVRLNESIQCDVTYLPTPGSPSLPGAFTEPWRNPGETVNRLAGRRISRRQTSLRGGPAEVVYRFRMRGAQAASGNAAGGVVGTPAIDDVTLTYFLPSPKIVLQEEVE